jgi:sugar transferase (PEP-CTERM/EpsH1 system associated)
MKSNEAPLVAHVIFRLHTGGLENGLVNLINRLPRQEYRHAIVCIDRSTEFARRIRRPDVEIIEIRKRPGHDPSAIWRLYKAFRRLRPDIVHTRNLGAMDALLPAMLAGVKRRIHGEHGWDIDDLEGRNRRNQWLRRLHAPLISEYVTVSEHLFRYLVERVGIDPGKITHICNGVDTTVFTPPDNDHPECRELRTVFGPDTFVVGSVGRMQSVKDHLCLARAFIALRSDEPGFAGNLRLAIAGDGEMRQAVLDELSDAGLATSSWIPGDRHDIPEIMRSLHLYVQPSVAEGISNTILEAMASGLPIIATNVGGNPELLRDGIDGRLFPAGDVGALGILLRQYLGNPDRMGQHGRAARERAVSVFGMDVMVQKYRALYANRLQQK